MLIKEFLIIQLKNFSVLKTLCSTRDFLFMVKTWQDFCCFFFCASQFFFSLIKSHIMLNCLFVTFSWYKGVSLHVSYTSQFLNTNIWRKKTLTSFINKVKQVYRKPCYDCYFKTSSLYGYWKNFIYFFIFFWWMNSLQKDFVKTLKRLPRMWKKRWSGKNSSIPN